MLGAFPIASVPHASLGAGRSYAREGPAAVLLTRLDVVRIHAIEVAPLDPVTHAPVPLWWADHPFTSQPTDTPANQTFQGRVNQALRFTQRLPREQVLGTDTSATAGEIEVLIGDGALDAYLDHIWEGRPLVVKVGTPGMAYADFATLFTGMIQTKPAATRTAMTLRLRDPRELLDQPILTETYAGTGGLEGPEALKGTVKPRAYGHLTGVPAVLLDPTNLIYQWSASSVLEVTAVRDKGVPLTFDAGPVTFGLWNDVGKYRVNLAQGTLQLGGAPAGQITVDGIGKAQGTAVQVLRTMLEDLHPSLPLDAGSFTTESRGGGRGYAYVKDQETWASLVPRLLGGQGSVLVPDRLGAMTVVTLRLGQTPTATIPADRITDEGLAVLVTPNPAWRLRFEFQHNWTPIDENASAGGLDAETKRVLARAVVEDELKDDALRALFPLAEDPAPLVANLTGLDFGEMERLFALVAEPRRLYRIPLIGRPFTMTLGQPVLLEASRPLAHEKRGAILTIDEDAQTNVVTLEVLV